MLKRFCNKCKQEIPEKDTFYRFTVQEVGHLPTPNPNKEAEMTNDFGSLDYCRNCFIALITEIGGEK